LQASRAQLRATDEGVPQARAGWRPTVSLSANAGYANTTVNLVSNPLGIPGFAQLVALYPNISFALPSAQGQVQIQQMLYEGGKTTAATSAAEAQVKAGRATLLSTEQQVFMKVITAYVGVIRDRTLLNIQSEIETLTRKQKSETDARFSAGTLTLTDTTQMQARLAKQVADTQAAAGALRSTEASYAALIGTMPGTLAEPELPKQLPASAEIARTIAAAVNPQVLAAGYNREAARFSVDQADADNYPTASLVGTYQADRNQTFPGADAFVASVSVTAKYKLYEGGATKSRVRQARETANQRDMDAQKAGRDVIETASKAYESYLTAKSRLVSLREQSRTQGQSYEYMRREAALGKRTTSDVLVELSSLQQARLSEVNARADEMISAYQLLSAVGGLTAEAMQLPTELYRPEDHYEKVRERGSLTDWSLD
jgi:TolC family type I secretion outer membrane protein